jgi:hypothetical protein
MAYYGKYGPHFRLTSIDDRLLKPAVYMLCTNLPDRSASNQTAPVTQERVDDEQHDLCA